MEIGAAVLRDADAWLTPGRFALLFGTLILACFPKVVFGSQTFFYRDFANFGYPLASYFRESFWNGEMPLWNPLNNCGIPFLAQWNTQTLYPLSLFYLIFPLPWSLGVFSLLHLFFAGLGMYFLAYHRTGNRMAAGVAGLVFGFNGLSWHCLIWPHYVSSLAWMPWTVLAVELAWRNGGRQVVWAALAAAMQTLSGTPEIIILTWAVLGVFWLADWAGGERPRSSMLVRFALVIGLMLALSAAQLLPFVDLLAHSQRDASFGTSAWSMPLSGWANYLVPLFNVHPSPLNVYMQYEQMYFSSYYLGIGTIALALAAICRVRKTEVWVLAGLVVYSLILAMGDNMLLYTWLKRIIPQIGFVRYPIKFVMLTTFLLPLLAAYAIARFRSAPENSWKPERKSIVAIAVAVLIAVIGIVVSAHLDPGPAKIFPVVFKNAAVRVCILLLIVGYVWVGRDFRESKERVLIGMAFLSLFWIDVFTHATSLAPRVNSNALSADALPRSLPWVPQVRAASFRAIEAGPAHSEIQYGWPKTPDEDVARRRLALFDNLNLLDHVGKADGFYALYLREAYVVNWQLTWNTNAALPLRDFAGIAYMNGPTNPHSWTVRPGAMPIVTAGQQPRFTNGSGMYRGVIAPDFDPRRFVYLPTDAQGVVAAGASPDAKILSCTMKAHEVDIEAETSVRTILAVAQSFYHPWRATVDGNSARLWPANYAFQALELPSGKHRVRLVYVDNTFRTGAAVSALTLAGCVVCLGRRRKDLPLRSPARVYS